MRALRKDEIEAALENVRESDGVVGFTPRLHPWSHLEIPADPADLNERRRQVIEVGVALSAETNIGHLFETILAAAKHTARADSGTIYRVTAERTLKIGIMRTDSLDIAMCGTSGPEMPSAPIPLYDKDDNPIDSNVAAYAYHHDTSLNIADAYTDEGFDFSLTREFDRRTGYRSSSFLVVPMKNDENEIVGVLQLSNARHPVMGEVVPFSDEDRELAESLASRAAVRLTHLLLINRLQDPFESSISLVNGNISHKSPYWRAL